MTRSMAVEYAPFKIRVNALAPAITLSERLKARLQANRNPEKYERLVATQLLGLVQPVEIADMAVYLASDESRPVTGQILSICSGASVY